MKKQPPGRGPTRPKARGKTRESLISLLRRGPPRVGEITPVKEFRGGAGFNGNKGAAPGALGTILAPGGAAPDWGKAGGGGGTGGPAENGLRADGNPI